MILRRHADALSWFSHVRVRNYRVPAFTAACHAEVGDIDSAKLSVAECLSWKPDFSVAKFMRKSPFKLAADAERVAASMRLAGLPE